MKMLRDEVPSTKRGIGSVALAAAAVVARPIGGVLADRFGPKVVSLISLAGIVSAAYIVGQQPPEGVLTGAVFLLMASAMGLGMGAVFAWVGPSTPPDKVGAVSGVVVNDTLPNGARLSAPWTCVATGAGSSCPANGGAAGDAAISLSVSLDATGTATITVPVSFNADPAAY